MSRLGRLLAVGPLAVLALAVACSDSGITAPTTPVETAITVSQGTLTSLASPAILASLSGEAGLLGPIDPAAVDSLILIVTRVEVLPDSGLYYQWRHQMRHRFAGDTTAPRPQPQWGARAADWYSFDVVGSGRLDLMHLPTTPETGLTLATAEVPPGDYGHARLFVSAATIYFNTAVNAGTYTFAANTGYTVTIPSVDSTGIKSDVGFTVPEGGGDVQLAFDPETAVRNAVATSLGAVVLAPTLKSRGRTGGR